MKLFIGIDPGQDGGICWLDETGNIYAVETMPKTETDLWEMLSSDRNSYAIVEKVHAMPGNGVSGMFKFGMGYGGIRMALIAAEMYRWDAVSPQDWMKSLSIPPRKKTVNKTDWKKSLWTRAKKMVSNPNNIQIEKNTGDAVLIAEYCYRRFG